MMMFFVLCSSFFVWYYGSAKWWLAMVGSEDSTQLATGSFYGSAKVLVET